MAEHHVADASGIPDESVRKVDAGGATLALVKTGGVARAPFWPSEPFDFAQDRLRESKPLKFFAGG